MIRKLERTEWTGFFDRLSKRREGRYAAIEVASRDIGCQIQATAMLVQGIVYDRKSNLLELVGDRIDHVILEPQELYVDGVLDELSSIAVRDADGALQILTLRALRALPPHIPDGAGSD
jgi:hypothetical protein